MSESGTNLPFAAVQNYVRFLRYSSREMLALRLSHFDPEAVIGHLFLLRSTPLTHSKTCYS